VVFFLDSFFSFLSCPLLSPFFFIILTFNIPVLYPEKRVETERAKLNNSSDLPKGRPGTRYLGSSEDFWCLYPAVTGCLRVSLPASLSLQVPRAQPIAAPRIFLQTHPDGQANETRDNHHKIPPPFRPVLASFACANDPIEWTSIWRPAATASISRARHRKLHPPHPTRPPQHQPGPRASGGKETWKKPIKRCVCSGRDRPWLTCVALDTGNELPERARYVKYIIARRTPFPCVSLIRQLP
jgi:hypothetical protein